MRHRSASVLVRAIVVGSFLVIAAACTARPREGGTAAAPRRDRSIMDTTELRNPSFSTVYDAISALHPDWLLPRGGPVNGVSPTLGVWIEGNTRSFGVGYLRNLRPIDIRQVRRLATTETLHTYNWPWGGLVISLR